MENCLLCLEIAENFIDIGTEEDKESSVASLIIKYFPFCFDTHPVEGFICGKCHCQVEAFHIFYTRIESIHTQNVFVPEPLFVDTLDSLNPIIDIKTEVKVDFDFHSEESKDSDYFPHDVDVEVISPPKKVSHRPKKYKKMKKVEKDSQTLKRSKYIGGPLVCEICGDKLLTENQLQRHIKLTHELLPHKCPIRKCIESYLTKDEMENHIEKIHPRAPCPICNNLIQKKYLQTHIQLYHEKLHRSICDVCGKDFIKPNDLKMHKTFAHERRDKPTCDICGTKTKDLVMMRAHMRGHIDGAQKCDICFRMFPNKKALRNHQIIHREHKFSCDVCGRGFHRPSKFKEHYSIHTGELNLYKCQCGTGFRFSSSYYTHKKKCPASIAANLKLNDQ